MSERPDYRKSPSATPEGSSRARDRRRKYLDGLPVDVLADAHSLDRNPTPVHDYPEDVRHDIAQMVRQESELLGFWLAWHRAGGFAALEQGGWHRATLFRKVRAFRDRFHTHPDDYKPDWITLRLTKVWTDDIRRRVDHDPGWEPDDLEP